MPNYVDQIKDENNNSYSIIGATSGYSSPTLSTQGVPGQLYIDLTNHKVYVCTDDSDNTYTWLELSDSPEPFIIEVTYDGVDYTCDKTFAEIESNFNSDVFIKFYDNYYGAIIQAEKTTSLTSGTDILMVKIPTSSQSSAYYLITIELDYPNQSLIVTKSDVAGTSAQGSGAPLASSSGYLYYTFGSVYINTTTGNAFVCTNSAWDPGDDIWYYTWKRITYNQAEEQVG